MFLIFFILLVLSISLILFTRRKSRSQHPLVFQNNDEIRASWGFAWSMAFIDVERWKVTNIEKKDVYALEWSINQVYPAKDK